APDKIDVEGRTDRVLAPAATGDASARLARDRIVHRDDPRPVRLGGLEGLPANLLEYRLHGQALQQPVVGSPVMMLPTGGTQRTGDGVAPQVEQAGHPLAAG